MNQIVGPLIRRNGAAILRRSVLQQLDSRTGVRAQAGDVDNSAGDSGQMFLFDPRVVTCADNGKSEQVAVEPQTRVGIADGDGAMVYAEEQLARGGMPLRLPFVGREVDELQRVAVGIPEVEGFDAGGIDIPIGKALRAG